MMSQKIAVITAVTSILADKGIKFEENVTKVEDHFTDTMREALNTVLSEGFRQGKIALKDTPSNQAKLDNPTEMKKYVSGLISNWFRKDKALNGGVEYEPKNPGSRAGAGDDQLRALKALIKSGQFKGTAKETEINKHIALRQAAIAKEKVVSVDLTVLPADLVATLGLKAE